MAANHSKIFVLDTDVLLHNPNALFMFVGHVTLAKSERSELASLVTGGASIDAQASYHGRSHHRRHIAR